jgi:hypothetical protein
MEAIISEALDSCCRVPALIIWGNMDMVKAAVAQ